MPIQIIPKEAAQLPLWQNILFYFSIGLVLSFLAAYGVLYHFTTKANLDAQNIDDSIQKAKTPQMISLENQLKTYRDKINDFATIINHHKIVSNFFKVFLESNTHPGVFFSEMDLDLKNEAVNLFGQTDNFQNLGQQISLFRREELRGTIKSIQLSKVDINREEKIEFSLVITFYPQLFKY